MKSVWYQTRAHLPLYTSQTTGNQMCTVVWNIRKLFSYYLLPTPTEPVAAHYVFDETNFSGISNLWIKNIVPFFLTTNVRQLEDPNYASLLNRVRTGEQTVQDITILSQRTSVDWSKPPFINALRLYQGSAKLHVYFLSLNIFVPFSSLVHHIICMIMNITKI